MFWLIKRCVLYDNVVSNKIILIDLKKIKRPFHHTNYGKVNPFIIKNMCIQSYSTRQMKLFFFFFSKIDSSFYKTPILLQKNYKCIHSMIIFIKSS